jgi:ribulose-5-phosphate 4-epimerase/fuculose-1-phosphate aldolase
MAEQEGVIKYQLTHEDAPLPSGINSSELNNWRAKLSEVGLIGQDPARYDGYGFGNLSQRYAPGGFVITGSQTGELPELGASQYAWVKSADTSQNAIISLGETKPSSEALTHAAVYDTCPQVQFIFHAHSPDIWVKGSELGVPVTEDVPYGTPEMAREVTRLLNEPGGQEPGIFTMRGHEDGVVAYGATAREAGSRLLEFLCKARSLS